MANEYYTIVTNAGRALEVQAKANNVPLKLTQMAVGDGGANGNNFAPSATQTKLVGERWRGNLNTLSIHTDTPTWLVAEAVLPNEVGGWWIREVGLFSQTGVLYAIAKYPPTYKPILADGANKMLYLRMIFEVTNTANVTLQVDPSIVMATRAYVEDRVDVLYRAQAAQANVQVQTLHRQLDARAYVDEKHQALQQQHQTLRQELHRAQTAQAGVQVQTLHRQLDARAYVDEKHQALQQQHQALQQELHRAQAAQAGVQVQTLNRQLAARAYVDAQHQAQEQAHQELHQALYTLAAIQIHTMQRQLVSAHNLPPNP